MGTVQFHIQFVKKGFPISRSCEEVCPSMAETSGNSKKRHRDDFPRNSGWGGCSNLTRGPSPPDPPDVLLSSWAVHSPGGRCERTGGGGT